MSTSSSDVGRSTLDVDVSLIETLEDRVVLAIDRQAPARLSRAASRITISPAMTRISLLATARSFPASIAASAGRNPPVPTTATSTISASSRQAISHQPAFARENLRLVFEQRRAARRPSIRPPDRPLSAERHSPAPPAFSRCCSRPGRRSPSAPEYRAPLSARFRRSIRSRPERQRVFVSSDRMQSFLLSARFYGKRMTSRR